MADHVRILSIYLAHLRCKAPTQSTRPRWCDVHAALEEAIRVMSEPATQPPAVGVDVSDAMDGALEAFEAHYEASSEDPAMATEVGIWCSAWKAARMTAALRTGGGE